MALTPFFQSLVDAGRLTLQQSEPAPAPGIAGSPIPNFDFEAALRATPQFGGDPGATPGGFSPTASVVSRTSPVDRTVGELFSRFDTENLVGFSDPKASFNVESKDVASFFGGLLGGPLGSGAGSLAFGASVPESLVNMGLTGLVTVAPQIGIPAAIFNALVDPFGFDKSETRSRMAPVENIFSEVINVDKFGNRIPVYVDPVTGKEYNNQGQDTPIFSQAFSEQMADLGFASPEAAEAFGFSPAPGLFGGESFSGPAIGPGPGSDVGMDAGGSSDGGSADGPSSGAGEAMGDAGTDDGSGVGAGEGDG